MKDLEGHVKAFVFYGTAAGGLPEQGNLQFRKMLAVL